MGNIGEPVKTVEFEPMPEAQPAQEPSPAITPVPAPVAPAPELVPA